MAHQEKGTNGMAKSARCTRSRGPTKAHCAQPEGGVAGANAEAGTDCMVWNTGAESDPTRSESDSNPLIPDSGTVLKLPRQNCAAGRSHSHCRVLDGHLFHPRSAIASMGLGGTLGGIACRERLGFSAGRVGHGGSDLLGGAGAGRKHRDHV
jgi:hypothetical protein